MAKPWVISNTASTIDGKIAPFDRSEVKISTEEDFARRDIIRSAVDAIIVGGETVRNDDPSLKVYDDDLRRQRTNRGLPEHPLGVVVTSDCDIPYNGAFINCPYQRRLIITSHRTPASKVECYQKKAEVLLAGNDRVDLVAAMDLLSQLQLNVVLLEGGGTLLFSMLQKNLVDEMFVSINSLIFGGKQSPTIVDGAGFSYSDCPRPRLVESLRQDDCSVLLHYVFH